MKHPFAKNDALGFTLVEMMVALVVVGIVTIAMVDIFRAQHQAQSRQNTGVERTMNSRAALDMMARELRNAGYDPRGTAGAGFVTTEPTEIEWTADLNADGDTDDLSDFGDDHVRYYFDADAGEIIRDVAGVEAVVADNISSLTFTYLDASLNPAGSSDQVKLVNIALTYDTPSGVMAGELETQVAIRNQITAACATMPAIVVDGDLVISGNADILGCSQGVHTNGNLSVSGSVTVAGTVSATGSVSISGAVSTSDGEDVEPLEDQEEIDVESYQNPTLTHCDDADYTLTQQGKVVEESTGTEYDATSSAKFGWRRTDNSPVIWEYAGDSENEGTFCVEGSVKLSGNPGSSGSPISMTIVAKGSIEISGGPHITADDPNGILFLAGGDIKISGNPSGEAGDNGQMYAYSQCAISGTPDLSAQLQCKDRPTPGHAVELTDDNTISGTADVGYGCAGGC
jgi:type IV pilus assembly protein PilW